MDTDLFIVEEEPVMLWFLPCKDKAKSYIQISYDGDNKDFYNGDLSFFETNYKPIDIKIILEDPTDFIKNKFSTYWKDASLCCKLFNWSSLAPRMKDWFYSFCIAILAGEHELIKNDNNPDRSLNILSLFEQAIYKDIESALYWQNIEDLTSMCPAMKSSNETIARLAEQYDINDNIIPVFWLAPTKSQKKKNDLILPVS